MDRSGIQQDSAQIEAVKDLSEVLGPKGIFTQVSDRERYASDQSGLAGTMPVAVLRPASTEEVSRVLAICSRYRPTRPLPSPTTVSAVKLMIRPPLTVLDTRHG